MPEQPCPFLAGKLDGHFIIRFRPTPDRHRGIALQDGMIGEQAGELEFRGGQCRRPGEKERGDDEKQMFVRFHLEILEFNAAGSL